MGLHVTPYGTFYVQRSLRTGEVMQVLPVKRPDMPDSLPSVDSLGITDNFIERRRASLAADTARVSDSQGRLQQELATAGGENLLATGKAVLAQSGSGSDSNAHNSPSAPNYDGDVEMAYGSSTAGSASGPPTSPASYQHSATRQSSSNSHRSSNMNYVLSEHPHQQSSSSAAMAQHMLPVRSWPDALHQEATVNLPPFRDIDSARALAHEEEVRHEEQISSRRESHSHGGSGSGSRRKSTASPRMPGLLRSSSRNSSRSSSTSGHGHGHNHGHGHSHGHSHRSGHGHNNNSISSSTSNAFSINNMISHGSEGSVSSAYSVSEASTPSAPFSPGPDLYYGNSSNGYSPATTYAAMSPATSFNGNGGCNNSMMIDGGASPQVATPLQGHRSSKSSTPGASRGQHRTRTSPSPAFASPSVFVSTSGPCGGSSAAPYVPPVPHHQAAPSSLTAPPPPDSSQKKNKTVWIIRTLEPRKTTSRRTANGAEDYDDYEPQRVQTHVETHIVP